ncbi:hypothetical protein EJ05DRAFT_506275 [Pseudovirgaria hyperparasitica]|uniref:Cytoplasmic tRNA 2-thiolation protein 2 n=1 Tax=Pseudovirgaria hyperparasitica TaxID=470096 RepID=A0A6A6WJT2_9PEZI|nr:uncharacterized protein EJ05DRAFT_506275 [Pseudovirgaria hyperparasitica]KAF2762556.1 hypothetical protein EJ05DRAFT_506275 [Pseudovirgaria hyperparasitica]
MTDSSIPNGSTKPCGRCTENPATLFIRASHFCDTCFKKYIRTKVTKRLDPFKVRNSASHQQHKPPTLLLPLTFTPSALALLEILDWHYRAQKARTGGRAGFELLVLYVALPAEVREVVGAEDVEEGVVDFDVDCDGGEGLERRIARLREMFPAHEVRVVWLGEEGVPGDLKGVLLGEGGGGGDGGGDGGVGDGKLSLATYLRALPSRTARADALALLKARFITSFATAPLPSPQSPQSPKPPKPPKPQAQAQTAQTAHAILHPQTTTSLAERTLCETAKGRAYALPHLTSEAARPHGIPTYFPARDLLRRELGVYLRIVGVQGRMEGLGELVFGGDDDWVGGMGGGMETGRREQPVTKNTTIEGLMRAFFEDVERGYPGIVANVVRTVERFERVEGGAGGAGGARDGDGDGDEGRRCVLCRMVVLDGRFGGVGWGGDQGGGEMDEDEGDGERSENKGRRRLCYGCSRSVP